MTRRTLRLCFLFLVGMMVVLCAGLLQEAPQAAGKPEAASQKRPKRNKKNTPPPSVAWLNAAASDTAVYYARSNGLVAFDMADATQPVELGRLSIRASVFGVTLQGSHAWLAAGTHGLILADVTDPTEPAVLARHETPGSVRQVIISGTTAILADHRQGVVILDITHPTRTRQLATLSTRGKTLALAARGSILATADGPAGVRLFDISHPRSPRRSAILDEIRDARDVALIGDLLIVAAARDGVLIYRLDENQRPHPVGSLDTPGRQAQMLHPTDRGLILGLGAHGLSIVDIADPANPRIESSLKLPQSYPVLQTAVLGDRVYIASGEAGFAVVDLNPADGPAVLYPAKRRMRISFP